MGTMLQRCELEKNVREVHVDTPHRGVGMAALIWREFDSSRRLRSERWALHDQILYDMCRAHPNHTDPGEVNAKVGIIARSYATGIERKIGSDGSQSSALRKLCDFILAKGALVDRALAPLRGLEEPLTPDGLRTIVESHGRLVSMLRKLLRDGQASRSFWSKYLHFHSPVVPVYDSYVAAQLPSHVRWSPKLDVFGPSDSSDEVYRRYVLRFFALYQRVRKERPDVRVKEIDFYLLGS
jgi:hypothetical protein